MCGLDQVLDLFWQIRRQLELRLLEGASQWGLTLLRSSETWAAATGWFLGRFDRASHRGLASPEILERHLSHLRSGGAHTATTTGCSGGTDRWSWRLNRALASAEILERDLARLCSSRTFSAAAARGASNSGYLNWAFSPGFSRGEHFWLTDRILGDPAAQRVIDVLARGASFRLAPDELA